MAKSSKIRIMISSRCNDKFPIDDGRSLSKIRVDLKEEIEALEIFGKKIFEVWINEKTPPQGGWDSLDVCIEAVKDCDILIVLNNGNAGWAETGGDVGICHAELMTGLSQAPGKVRIVSLESQDRSGEGTPEYIRNEKFRDYVKKQNIFRGGTVNTEDDLKERVKEALRQAVLWDEVSLHPMPNYAKGSFAKN